MKELLLSQKTYYGGKRHETEVASVPLKDAAGVERVKAMAMRLWMNGEKGLALRVVNTEWYSIPTRSRSGWKWIGGMGYIAEMTESGQIQQYMVHVYECGRAGRQWGQANPYPKDTLAHSRWEEGYYDEAREERSQAAIYY